MRCDDYNSPAFIDSIHNAPYNSSLATSASASSSSVWSDSSSQHSDDTSASTSTSDSDSCDSYCLSGQHGYLETSSSSCAAAFKLANPWEHQLEVAPELRQNPRRTSTSSTSRSGCPPPLVRQADRKVNFVDNLVDSSTQIVEAIWPTSSVVCRNETGSSGVLPLRTFIQETLRRSRTSYSTLQVALYYLVLIKPHVPNHDFTMEQTDDSHASRTLQCGRRMFLAALILASKYLQDRNYSARAWSKISGLNTQEINQNEMSFVTAVNWKLHITEEVYNRWTDCVMKHTPTQPPSPGGGFHQRLFERQCEDFKRIILNLTPDLENLDDIVPWSPAKLRSPAVVVTSPRALFTPSLERACVGSFDGDATPTPKAYGTPAVMEPSPATVHTPGRLAPALGLLPTPRLTPQTSGFGTPAVSSASYFHGKIPSMSVALAQANASAAVQYLDRWPASITSSPQSYVPTRRSSLANTISTASSPESMISDVSRTSRSSSISSASSLASAPSVKLDVQARCRYAKLCGERNGLRPIIASVPEDYEENCMSASPENYTGPVAKDLCDLSLDTPLGRRQGELADDARKSVNDAARALQDLHNYRQAPIEQPSTLPKTGSKRSRPLSMDNSLQDNVREMLAGSYNVRETAWADSLVRSRVGVVGQSQQVPVRATMEGGRKRVCCSTEAAESFMNSSLHPVMGGFEGPGMWEGILN